MRQRDDANRPGSLPLVVFVLAGGTFVMGTTEFMIAGLLPEIARATHVSEARAGLLVTAFAVGMIVGSPVMAVATRNLPHASMLILALAIFAAGHLVAALSSSFAILIGARLLTGLSTGMFWAVASVVAVTAAGPKQSTRALGVVIAGATLANVVGVPIGSWIGHLAGWRGPFWALAALSLAAVALVVRFVPSGAPRREVSPRAELAALRQGRIWLAFAASALIMGGVLGTYTYISPLLTRRAGIPAGDVPLVLMLFGAGAVLGSTIGGRLGDRRPLTTTITAAAATALVLGLLTVLSTSPAATVILIGLIGVAAFAINPVVTALAVRFGNEAPTLAAAFTTSAFNVGIAAGSWISGIAFSSALGISGPMLVGTVISALTLIPLVSLAVIGATRVEAPPVTAIADATACCR